MGDELDTNIALDPEFQTFSDSESDDHEGPQGSQSSEENESESDGNDDQPSVASTTENDAAAEVEVQERKRARQESAEASAKKAKKKQKLQEIKEKKRKKAQEEKEAITPLAKRTAEQQAEAIWTIFLDKRGESLSSIEKEHALEAQHIIDFHKRGTYVDGNVLDIVKSSVSNWEATRQKRTATGEPSVIIVTSSARRAVNLLKSLSKIKCLGVCSLPRDKSFWECGTIYDKHTTQWQSYFPST
eukprot:gb/GECG01009612.1/.p1 GENE.gb/GECG01009612.1/~~gb/GECG01009612.1/.p1  ORF type:complete len:244 (+),score=48.80 gb/GECG01009612.1/:1-732(+)